jgi:dTDP-4-dehydrorhamnose 3,5-epimerase
MKIATTALAGVVVIETKSFVDSRGSFARLFCEQDLAATIGERHVVQINHSRTTAVGAVRGLHFQHPPYSEMKLIRCLKGRVWDVAVDLRSGSQTFLHWYAEELTPENARMLVIPEGCAHGFQVLEANSELLYLHTASYSTKAETGVRFDDARLGITWPLPPGELSERDRLLPVLMPDFEGVVV